MKPFRKKHLQIPILHKNQDSRSKGQNKKEIYFITITLKTNVNKIFFMVKRNFISGNFHFEFHVKRVFVGPIKYFRHILMGHKIFFKIFDGPRNIFVCSIFIILFSKLKGLKHKISKLAIKEI